MKNIEEIVQNILLRRTGIDFTNQEIKKKFLLGKELNIPARELVLVYLDIENEFNILIKERDVLEGGFKTYNNILDTVRAYI